jgi:short-subunit dehydrogenase
MNILSTSLLALGGTLLLARAVSRARHFEFRRKVVLITGGSRGLGLVLARQLADEGAHLMLVARDKDELARAVADVRRRQPLCDVHAIEADLRRQPDAERAVTETVRRYGGIDVLINNAGTIQVGPAQHMQLDDYEDAMRTHFWAPLYMVRAARPVMRRQGGGRIVNVSSIGGRVAVPHLLPYSASKFALAGLSQGLRIELAPEQITVTAVYPGLMRTGSPVNAHFKGDRAAEYAWFAAADSLPLATVSAERAARQILAACQRGEAELVITVPAKLAVLAQALAPELFSDAMALANRLLPSPIGTRGSDSRSGREVMPESGWAFWQAPVLAAARRNNE